MTVVRHASAAVGVSTLPDSRVGPAAQPCIARAHRPLAPAATGVVEATEEAAAIARRRRRRLESCWRHKATQLLRILPRPQSVDFMEAFILPYAVQAQCAFWGGPLEMETALRYWTRPCQAELRGGEPSQRTVLAQTHLRALVRRWRIDGPRGGERELAGLFGPLLEPLSETQAVALLADWTTGQVDRLAASMGSAVLEWERSLSGSAGSDVSIALAAARRCDGTSPAALASADSLGGELQRLAQAQQGIAIEAIRAELPSIELLRVVERRESSRPRYAPLVLRLG